MPRIRRRSFLAGSVASLAAASIGGCSDGDEGGLGKQTGGQPRGDTEKFRGEIVIATLGKPPEQARQALTSAYRKHQPDVEIRWETEDWSDTGAYADWLGTQLAADEIGPDIVSGNFLANFRGYVNFEEYRQQTNPYTGNVWDDDYQFDLYPELNSVGERVLIGTEGGHLFWYYNQEIFTDLELEPPQTWDDLLAICSTLKQADLVPISANFDDVVPGWFPPLYFDQYHTDWVNVVRVQEGDWSWNPELDPRFEYDPLDPTLHAKYTYSPQRFYKALRDKELRYDTGPFAAMVENLAKVFPAYSNSDLFVRVDQYTPFLQGEAAMMVDGSGALTLLDRDLQSMTPERMEELGVDQDSVQPFDWDVFEFPSMEGEFVQSETVRPPEGTTGYYLSAIDKNAERTAMVMDFLMFWISEPGYDAFVSGQVEAGELTPQGPPLVNDVAYPPDVAELFQMVDQKGIVGPAYGNFWVSGAGGTTGEELKNLFIEVLQGKTTPTAYGKQVQKYVQDNFDELLELASLAPEDLENPARRPQSI